MSERNFKQARAYFTEELDERLRVRLIAHDELEEANAHLQV